MPTLYQHYANTIPTQVNKRSISQVKIERFKNRLMITAGIKKKNVMPSGVIPLKEGIDAARS